MNKNFKLFIGKFPTGTMFCNMAVYEHGDYKKLAYCFDTGELVWYVPKDNLPADAVKAVYNVRQTAKAAAEKVLDTWLSEEKEHLLWDNIFRLSDGYALSYDESHRLADMCRGKSAAEAGKIAKDFFLEWFHKEKVVELSD